MSDYEAVIESKRMRVMPVGIDVGSFELPPFLYPFQSPIVRWAAKRGRAAIWADCGMGKTPMQLAWAHLMTRDGGRCIILAPLAVARQTVEEARKFGYDVPYVRTPQELGEQRVVITNYERLDAFDGVDLRAVVCDESSILKSFDGSTRGKLIERFSTVPYRLACTATPAPNDYLELGNHAQFLGIMSWQEMAAMFFVHDQQAGDGNRGAGSGAWRLKGHAEEDFWHWLVTWGVFIRRPSDIGYDDDRFKLPKLDIQECIVKTGAKQDGQLFATRLHGVSDRAKIRKQTLEPRVRDAVKELKAHKGQSIAWCAMNGEADAIAFALGDECRNVTGNDDPEKKADDLDDFRHGKYRILVSKPRIAGFGLNLQNCAHQVFVGLGDSYEQYYQCIRRSWRYGQTKPVKIVIVTSEIEERIVSNVKEKEREADRMADEMVKRMSDLETQELKGSAREEVVYRRDKAEGEEWTMHLGDCVDVM